MQRILNNPDDIVDEMLRGFLKAHADIVEGTENPRVVKAKNIPEGKVGVITGGGSGHKPAFIGYIGKNLCDAVAVGEICSSPTAAAFSGCREGGGSGERRCLPLRKLFRRQHECKNGCQDGEKGRPYCEDGSSQR